LWPHPHRVETVAPLTRGSSKSLAATGDERADPFDGCRRPRIVLLLDASAGKPRLEATRAGRMADEVRALAERAGGSALALTGPGIRPEVAAALSQGLRSTRALHQWGPQGVGDYLSAADAVVVNGDDAQMVAEAAASGRPVYVYPAPEPVSGRGRRVSRWIEKRAHQRPSNRRGTPRPQQGLEYLCARLLERGITAPVQDLGELHRALYDRGIALPFGAPLDVRARPALRETPEAARRVAQLLGYPPGAGSGPSQRL
jgi:hypothetical protein